MKRPEAMGRKLLAGAANHGMTVSSTQAQPCNDIMCVPVPHLEIRMAIPNLLSRNQCQMAQPITKDSRA